METHELWEKYGYGKRIKSDDPRIVIFAFDNEEAAEAYAVGNRVHHGHPSWVEKHYGEWWNVIDIGPAIDRASE
jgi:hypothetical protein